MSEKRTDETTDLKEKTISGIHWRFLTTVTQLLLTFSVGVLLARILPPEDFGLLGMAIIFTGFADLFATVGMGPAIVQRKELDDATIGTATFVSVLTSLALTAFFFFAAPAIAAFFHEPRITLILRVLSVLFLLNGLSAISRALIVRELKFKSLFYQEIVSFLFGYGVLAVFMALHGFGVWSLVAGTFLKTVISCALLLYLSPSPLRLSFDRKKLAGIFGFGAGVSINDILWYTSDNIDYLLISRYFSPTALGFYTRAFDIMKQPVTRFSNVISSVTFPAYSRIQEDRERMGRIYLRGVDIVSIISFPVLTGIALASHYVIVGIYGPNWSGAITVLQILSVAGMLKAVSHLAGAVTHATGNVYSEVRIQGLYVLSLLLLCLWGVRYGIEGVAVAVVLSSLIFYLSMAQCVLKILAISWSSFFKAQRTGAILAIIVGMVDVVCLIVFSRFQAAVPPVAILFGMVVFSLIGLLTGILILPKSVKGDSISWIMLRYRNIFPRPLFNFVMRYV